MDKYFPKISKPIAFEGRESKNPFAYKYYDKDRIVMGKSMADHLRFAVAYWHTFKGDGSDPFGMGTMVRPWDEDRDPMAKAKATCEAAFEFVTKLDLEYYCFHDRDLAPEGESFGHSCANLEEMVAFAGTLQQATGKKLLWGTANLFSHPRYCHGAGTSPDVHVFAYGAAQVKHAISATKELGGENYVFWGGREGYETLLNTDMKREQEQMARFLHLAVEYAKEIGFTGQFLIEPKPKEPTKHQYDFDCATVLSFLKMYDLEDFFKINVEANHATLAGHSFEHDLAVAANAGKLGSIDVNRGDTLLGWDTDQFPTDIYSNTHAMLVVLGQGGIGSGGLNFDAKVRRGSCDLYDLFHAHIGGIDSFARALLIAARIIEDGVLPGFVQTRYATWESALGQKVLSGQSSLAELEQFVLERGEPQLESGRQEYLENIVNSYM